MEVEKLNNPEPTLQNNQNEETVPVQSENTVPIREENTVPASKPITNGTLPNGITITKESQETLAGFPVIFLIVIGLGGILSFFNGFASMGELPGELRHSTYGDSFAIQGIGLLLLAIYTIFCFKTRKSGAMFLGKGYIITVFLINLLGLINLFMIGGDPNVIMQPIMTTMVSIIWDIVWFIYLCTSDQLAEVFPKERRKASVFDWAFVLIVALLPYFMQICYISSL